MSWLIVGTVPNADFPLVEGTCRVRQDRMSVGDRGFPLSRGTPALIAAATMAAEFLGAEPPTALLCGDVGDGKGSVKIYRHLVTTLDRRSEDTIIFHYLQPDLDWHNRILLKIEDLAEKPLLIADAGYMYVGEDEWFCLIL